MQAQPADVVKRVQPLHTSARSTSLLPDNAVDSIFLHAPAYISEAGIEMAILREFERVTRDSVFRCGWMAIFKSWRRKRSGKTWAGRLPEHRFCVTGRYGRERIRNRRFPHSGTVDFIPLYAMWRGLRITPEVAG